MFPSIRIMERVLAEAARGGLVRSYYTDNVVWEAALRNDFSAWVTTMRDPTDVARERGEELLRRLDGAYRAGVRRYAAELFPAIATAVIEEIADAGFFVVRPRALLEAADEEVPAITSIVPRILNRIPNRSSGSPYRPYSLITKFLHFCFPTTFPIFDSWAAGSVRAWSFYAFDNRGPDWSRFANGTGSWPAGGYLVLAEFYRRLWNAGIIVRDGTALSPFRERLVALTGEVSAEFGAEVSVLDLIDKLLWIAQGDPMVLGLID